MGLNFRQKIVASFMAVGMIPMVVVACVVLYLFVHTSYSVFSDNLASTRDELAERTQDYFNGLAVQVRDVAGSLVAQEAVKSLGAAVDAMDVAAGTVPSAQLKERYAAQLQKSVSATEADVNAWMNADAKTIALQNLYIGGNPNPIGEKQKLDDAGDGSEYSKLHAKYHPRLRKRVEMYGYYDLFLVDTSGRVVYTDFKEIDFMQNALKAPLAETDLGKVMKKALESNDPNAFFVSDFGPYLPSYNDWQTFIAAPIIENGKTIGALAFQVPLERISALYAGVEDMGETSDAYMVDESFHLITKPLRLKRTVGEEFTGSIRQAFSKVIVDDEPSVVEYQGSDGRYAIASGKVINVPGVEWHMFVRIGKDEMFTDVYKAVYMVVGLIALTCILTALLGFGMAKTLTAPVRNLAQGFFRGAEKVAGSTSEVNEAVGSMVAASEETSAQSKVIRRNSSEAAGYVKSVSTAVSELNMSINDISRSIGETNVLIDDAVGKAQKTDEVVRSLGEASKKISDVVSLINDLADQTNLLALNAAIEAARAGDAGRGFAVVADEVKKLAGHTSQATVDIRDQVREIQDVSEQSVVALQAVVEAIHRIRDNATTVSAAVEEQSGVAKQIAGSVQDAASRVQQVDDNMTGIEQAAHDTGIAANQVSGAAGEVQSSFTEMKGQVQGVLDEMGIKA